MAHRVLCHSDAFQEYAHVANEIPVFEFMGYSICCKILILRFQVYFRVYTFPGVKELISVEHTEHTVSSLYRSMS